jgi:hypothetical protein
LDGGFHEPWDLDGLKALISRHPEHASDMAPTIKAIEFTRCAKDALVLIELALHCDAESAKIGKPGRFDPSRFLADGVIPGLLVDADMAVVIERLCELGAEVTPRLYSALDVRRDIYEQSRQMLRQCEISRESETIGKVTEEEAALYV